VPIDPRRPPNGDDLPGASRPADASGEERVRTKPGVFRRLFGIAVRVVVFAFVVWHLTYLVIANLASTDLADYSFIADADLRKEVNDVLDDSVYRYGRITATDQNWAMFGSPLWRKNRFLSGRIEFDDGSTEVVQTDSEPEDHTRYFRLGGWRLRKLEENMGRESESSYYEELRQRYGRYLAEQWRAANPDDARTPVRITLFRRHYAIPAPGEPRPDQPRQLDEAEEGDAIVTVELSSRADKGEGDS
jgi:hypothetical protein